VQKQMANKQKQTRQYFTGWHNELFSLRVRSQLRSIHDHGPCYRRQTALHTASQNIN